MTRDDAKKLLDLSAELVVSLRSMGYHLKPPHGNCDTTKFRGITYGAFNELEELILKIRKG